MIRLLARSSARYHLRHPGMLALSVLGVAMGVAVVTGIDAANSSARTAFRLSADAVAGRTTHVIRSAGGPMDEHVYRDLRRSGIRTIAPVVESFVRTPEGEVLTLLGIDPIADLAVRDVAAASGFPDPGLLLTRPGAVAVSSEFAGARGLVVGDTLDVSAEGRSTRLFVVGVVRTQDAYQAAAWRQILVADIATAQEAFGRVGVLDRIDARLDGPEAAALEGLLPREVRLERSGARTKTLSQMTEAFDLNLTALSYLALLVGVFLIYNIVSFSVVQRRAVWGRLRAVGLSRTHLQRVILVEALTLGVVGAAAGLALGALLADGLTRLVTRAINDLYFVVSVREVDLPITTFVKGVVLGVGCAVLAAWGPARSAARMSAVSVMRRSDVETRIRRAWPLQLLAAAVLSLGGGTLLVADTGIAGAYAGLLGVVCGFALAVPAFLMAAVRGVLGLMRAVRAPVLRMAVGSVSSQLSRTSVATAALAVAVAAALGVGVMVESFRGTVETWLSYTLQADVYVQPPGVVARRGGAVMDPALVREIRAMDGVAAAFGVRRIRAVSDRGEIDLVAIEHGPRSQASMRFAERRSDVPWEAFSEGALFVSEPFSFRYGIGAGDSLRLQTAGGPQRLPVEAVYFDYGSDLGAVMMDRARFERAFRDSLHAGLSLYLEPGVVPETVARRVARETSETQTLLVRSNADLKAASLEVFDRTFAVTWVLRILAVLVAVVGIVSALAALQLERRWEFGVLRAVGLLPGELRRLILAQSGLMGLFAGLLSLPLGLFLAYALVFVINRRSFGWTLQFDPSPALLAQALLVAVVAAVAAAVIPARAAARRSVSRQLRGEG